MGILNVTPDSFSDGGLYTDTEPALRHTEKMIADGADIIDVGGESTRPGYTPVPAAEETERVSNIIEAIKRRFDIPVSTDTYKSSVARAAIAAGADMINDIWGFKYDGAMAKLAAESGAACCLMHNRKSAVYGELIADMISDLKESVDIARAAGVRDEKIVLDPGIGFAKTQEQNLEVLRRLGELDMGFPMLLGTSRKSVIGRVLGTDTGGRLEGTLVTTVMAVQSGCMFVRVHDVKENKRAVMMTEAILGA